MNTYTLTEIELTELIETAYDKATRSSEGGYGPDITSLDDLLKHLFESLPSGAKKEDIPTEQLILDAYYAGFNQAHYSHLHPDVCPPKECESAAREYLNKKKEDIPASIQHEADDAYCAHKWLDDLKVPTHGDDGKKYSLVGRIAAYGRMCEPQNYKQSL